MLAALKQNGKEYLSVLQQEIEYYEKNNPPRDDIERGFILGLQQAKMLAKKICEMNIAIEHIHASDKYD